MDNERMQMMKGKIEGKSNQICCHRISGDSICSKCQEKNFQCKRCKKSFKEIRTLRLHQKIHSAEYPEQCEVCQKGFRTKWQLKQHLMDHGGKRPYPCPECSFTCKTKQQLNEHRRKHSGEKAYSCALCGTRFTYRNGLIKHTKLNRCPKRQNTPDSEKHNKKKNKDFGFAIHKEKKKKKKKKMIDICQNLRANNGPQSTSEKRLPLSLDSINLLTSQGTKTFLTSSSDISSWASTLPAGTKVTVTHYDASKSSCAGGSTSLVATPTHTETIIVTPPSKKSKTNFFNETQNQSISSDIQPTWLNPIIQPSLFESLAIDPKETLLNSKAVKQDFSPSHFNNSIISPIDVQLKAKELLMNVKPDPIFDPNIKIKTECSKYQNTSSISKFCAGFAPFGQTSNPNMNDIKKEVLDELFDLDTVSKEIGERKKEVSSFLVPQLSNVSESDDSILENGDFFTDSFEHKSSREKLDFDISPLNFEFSPYSDEHMNISGVNMDEKDFWHM